jgi:hypothetical protein
MKYLIKQYQYQYDTERTAKYSVVECTPSQKDFIVKNASVDGLNPDYAVECVKVRRNSIHDIFSPNSEYGFEQVRKMLREHGRKSVLMYLNIRGWDNYLTTRPTFATPTGQLKGYPSRIRIKID